MKSDIALESQKSQLLTCIGNQHALTQLFDQLPDTTFFVKNMDSMLVAGSRTFYERLGFSNEQQLLGKSDFDLFPTHMAEHFRRDDLSVMRSKVAVASAKIELEHKRTLAERVKSAKSAYFNE